VDAFWNEEWYLGKHLKSTPVSAAALLRTSDRQPRAVTARPARAPDGRRWTMSDHALTEAAIELLVERGIQGTTFRSLGERAGYSRGLATHRFGSKSGLFTHVMRTAVDRWLSCLQAAVGDSTGAEALCAAADALRGFVWDQPNLIRAMYILWFQSIDPGAEYRANVAAVHRAQREDVVRWVSGGQRAGTVKTGVEPRRVAEQYVATTAGIVYQWLVDPHVPLEAMFDQLKKDVRFQLTERVGCSNP
jgi:AcrR family transcriptional regulator